MNFKKDLLTESILIHRNKRQPITRSVCLISLAMVFAGDPATKTNPTSGLSLAPQSPLRSDIGRRTSNFN